MTSSYIIPSHALCLQTSSTSCSSVLRHFSQIKKNVKVRCLNVCKCFELCVFSRDSSFMIGSFESRHNHATLCCFVRISLTMNDRICTDPKHPVSGFRDMNSRRVAKKYNQDFIPEFCSSLTLTNF